jgi:hypothetical protein
MNMEYGHLGISACLRSPVSRPRPLPRPHAARHLESAVLAIITIDLRGLIEERLFDYSAQGPVGRNVEMLLPEPEHDAPTGR